MKASILFITYNHEKFVAEAVRSAMAQDYPELELVLCDDGSPDRTVEILERELMKCPARISVVRAHAAENLGFHENFNRGLAACTGDIIVPMSGDDVSLPHRVSRICGEFTADPDCMLVCSNWIRTDESGRDLGVRGKRREDGVFSYAFGMSHIYARAPVCGAAAAYRASLRDRFPPMQRGRHAEDNCFWVRALLTGNIHYVAEPLVLWRSHPDNQYNWTRCVDNERARSRHLRFLTTHHCMWRQWECDLAHALATNLITRADHDQLVRTVTVNQESYRLLRLSITPSAWKLWFASAFRILHANHSLRARRKWLCRILRRHLPLRLSERKRAAYWRSYFCGKS